MNEVRNIMIVLKDVQVRESTTQLTSVVGPMLSFPSAFQVVPDNIVAQEHILMKDYDVLLLPLDCTQTIPTQVFLLILQSFINIRIPNIIFMATHDEKISHEDLKTKSILRLTSNGSIPLDELVNKITTAVNPPIETIASIIQHNNISNIFSGITTTTAAVPVCGSPSHRRSGLNKRKRRSEAISASTATTTMPEHTLQYPYTHYGYPTTTTSGSSSFSQYTDEYGNSGDNAAMLYQQQLNAYYWHKHYEQQQYNIYNTTTSTTNTNTISNTSSNNSTTTDTTTTGDSCDDEFELCLQDFDFICDITTTTTTTTSGNNTTTLP